MNILEEVGQLETIQEKMLHRLEALYNTSVYLLLNISVANPRYVVNLAYILLHISLHIVGRDGLLEGVNKMDGVEWKLLILF